MSLPIPPSSAAYSAQAVSTLSNPLLNTTIPDCELSAAYHILGVLTGGNSAEYTPSDANMQALYDLLPYEDRSVGLIRIWEVMNYFINHGFVNGSKLIGVIELDPENETAIKTAIYQFQNAYVSLSVPTKWKLLMNHGNGWIADTTYLSFDPEDPGYIPYGAADTWHVMAIVGYSSDGVLAVSYGHLGTITWAALAMYCPQGSLNGGHVYEGMPLDGPHAQQGGGIFTWLCQDHICNSNSTDVLGNSWPVLLANFQEFATQFPLPVQYTGPAHVGQRTVRQIQVRGKNWRRGRRAEYF